MTELQHFDEITVGTWIHADSLGSYNTVSSRDVFILGVRDDGNGFYYEVEDTADTVFTARSGQAPSTGNWYHIALTYDQNELRGYVNGVTTTTVTCNGNALYNGDYGITIGNTDGTVDDTRLYGRALSTDEVYELYRWGSMGTDMRSELVTR